MITTMGFDTVQNEQLTLLRKRFDAQMNDLIRAIHELLELQQRRQTETV